jgi:23S rRNA pseudouridine1911/1915/1917 synthase
MDLETSYSQRQIEISKNFSGERVDKILVVHYPGLSRTQVQKFFRSGNVSCDGVPVAAKERLPIGKILKIRCHHFDEKQTTTAWHLEPFQVLFEDDEILVISKAPGIVVHRGNGTHGSTLMEYIAARGISLSAAAGNDRPGVVHRLDKETSGVMALAKTDHAYDILTKAFAVRNIHKTYHALVRGVPRCLSGSVQKAIGRHPIRRTKMCIREEGRSARSDWRLLETFGDRYTYLQVQIFTGRTHQIRVHMQYLGFPILGDKTYGYRIHASDPCQFDRVMLHAYRLEIPHPSTDESMIFEAPLAEDFQEKLKFLRHHFHRPLARDPLCP